MDAPYVNDPIVAGVSQGCVYDDVGVRWKRKARFLGMKLLYC